MTESEHESDLPDASGDDDEAISVEMDRMGEEARAETEQTKIWVSKASEQVLSLEVAQDNLAIEAQDADPVNNVNEVIPDEEPELRRQEATLSARLEEIAEQPLSARILAKAKYLVWTFKVVGVASSVFGIYAAIKQMIGTPSPPVDDDAKKLFAKAREWVAESDTVFWGDLASYITANDVSRDEQILFMQYTEDLYISQQPPPAVWTWNAAADKAQLVSDLIAEIIRRGLATVYQSIPSRTYDGLPLRRDIAADVLSLALASIHAAEIG